MSKESLNSSFASVSGVIGGSASFMAGTGKLSSMDAIVELVVCAAISALVGYLIKLLVDYGTNKMRKITQRLRRKYSNKKYDK